MASKKVIKSVSFLWIGSIIGSGSTFLVYTILGKKLGPEMFGMFSAVLSTITVFTLLASFGVAQVWLKLFGKEGWAGVRWIRPSLKLVLISLVVVTISVIIWAFFGPHNIFTKKLLLILIFFIYGKVILELVASKFQLEEKYKVLAIWQLIPNLLRLIIIVIFFYIIDINLTPIEVGFIYALVGLFIGILGILQLIKLSNGDLELKGFDKNISMEYKLPSIKNIINETWPFGLGSLFAFIYVQSDIIMVKYLAGDMQVGYYNASFIILTAIYILPSTLYQKFLMPKFHRWANYDREKFYNVYKKGNFIMFIVGSFIMICIFLTADIFIPLLFGKSYIESIQLIKILALNLPFYLIAFSVASVLVTKDNMKRKVKYMGVVALLNVALNFFLIPLYQAKGAAIATVISNAVLLIIYLYATKKYVFKK